MLVSPGTFRPADSGRTECALVGVVAEQCSEGSLPLALPFGEQFVGRGEAARHRAVERREIDRLVVALGIEPPAGAQAGMGDLDDLARQVTERQALELGGKPGARRVAAQVVVILDAPVL